MRTETTTQTIYQFQELSEESKEKALESLWDLNVSHEWWECLFDDAKRIGLKITSFYIDRHEIEGDLVEYPEEVARIIENEHGGKSGTVSTSIDYLEKREKLIDAAKKDKYGDFEDEWELDELLDELEKDFLIDILEDYLASLKKEYEYLTSESAIIETIDANEYEFTEEGEMT